MLRQRADRTLLAQLFAIDLVLTAWCWVAAYAVRWGLGLFPVVEIVPPFWWCIRALPLVLAMAAVSYHWNGMYQLGRRWPMWEELFRAAKAVVVLMVLLLAANFYLRDPYESRLASLLFAGFTTVMLVAARRCMGMMLHRKRRLAGRKALIVGSGRCARRLARALQTNAWFGLSPVGYVDDVPAIGREGSLPSLGKIEELPRLLDETGADYVFIALSLDRSGESRRVFKALEHSLVDVRIVPDVPTFAAMSVEAHAVEGLPILSLHPPAHDWAGLVAKRVMDASLAAIGLIVISPLLALVAIAVKLSSPGPIFYRQERMGLNGRRFNMIKFRTMRQDAESGSGPVWAKENDDRRTKLGAFLRKTSIDELPQLWNVLVGDMSLVGPRPERPFFISKFRQSIPNYMMRHAVKAGITGWAQVHGWRGNTSLRKRVQYDLYYIANWSPWLDLRILYLTLTRTLWDKNAY
jgi:exopolysaccharide biosynthesis polyprenyl glycosylphosphotransferase